jgi:hypothetical protein
MYISQEAIMDDVKEKNDSKKEETIKNFPCDYYKQMKKTEMSGIVLQCYYKPEKLTEMPDECPQCFYRIKKINN